MLRRRFSSLPRLAKYDFYDLVVSTHSHPTQPVETSLMTEKEHRALQKQTKTTFEGNYTISLLTPEERIAQVFGGRIKGESRQSSSRINVGEPRNIAGIMVPDRPKEPDNCCMSGCINCVWELYNDDVKEWNMKRKEAAAKLEAKGGVWPADFYPPVQYLKQENLPAGIKSATKSKPDEESWGNVPVQIRVFAEMEKKMKARKAAQEASLST